MQLSAHDSIIKAAKASGAARRKKSVRLKAEFLDAVRAGALLTQTGIVAPRTYQTWLKRDSEFAATVKKIVAARPKPIRPKRNTPRHPVKVPRKAQARAIFSNEIYIKAARLINRNMTPDIRESAISELMLMMLGGEEPDAGRAVRNARAEFSQLVGFTADAYHESIWEMAA